MPRSGGLQSLWEVHKQGNRVHGLRQKRFLLKYQTTVSVFKLLWEMQIKHCLFILVEGRAQTANLK